MGYETVMFALRGGRPLFTYRIRKPSFAPDSFTHYDAVRFRSYYCCCCCCAVRVSMWLEYNLRLYFVVGWKGFQPLLFPGVRILLHDCSYFCSFLKYPGWSKRSVFVRVPSNSSRNTSSAGKQNTPYRWLIQMYKHFLPSGIMVVAMAFSRVISVPTEAEMISLINRVSLAFSRDLFGTNNTGLLLMVIAITRAARPLARLVCTQIFESIWQGIGKTPPDFHPENTFSRDFRRNSSRHEGRIWNILSFVSFFLYHVIVGVSHFKCAHCISHSISTAIYNARVS